MRHGVGVEGELSDLHLLLPVDARSIKYLLYVYVLFIEQLSCLLGAVTSTLDRFRIKD